MAKDTVSAGGRPPAGGAHVAGHRHRARRRLLEGDAESLQDYELLELILFHAVPRADVKPLAKDLLAHFGDVNGVLNAEAVQLKPFTGIGENGLSLFAAIVEASRRLARGSLETRVVLASWQGLLAYCRTTLGHAQTEKLRLLYLDGKNRLIRDETLQEGTVNHTPLYVREIAKRALTLNASAVIVAHNHPSGDAQPSCADIRTTHILRASLAAVDVKLHDHVVITRSDAFSFRNAGFLEKS